VITITDISQELQVSTATVSRALNHSCLVAPDLGTQIRLTADKMGYKKRDIRRHRGRAILNIKLVLPCHEEPERALFYDLSSLIEGIRSGFQLCEINLLCEPTSDSFKPYPHKKGGDINGFIFAFHQPTPDIVKELRECNTPFAVLNRDIEGLPCVASENSSGMGLLIDHLVEHRKKPIKPAFLSLDGLGQIHTERLEGLENAAKKHQIDFNPEKDVRYFSGIRSIKRDVISDLMKSYNVLLCANDIVGTVVLSELERLGVSVPDQIAVTGFDDSPVRQLSRPLLTTIRMPVNILAKAAASRLESEIIEYTRPGVTLRVPGALVIGGTT